MIPNYGDVTAFLDRVIGAVRKRDAQTLLDLMARVTGQPPRMWGATIVGFGEYHYKYASGREGDSSAVGFAPRTAATTIYLPDGVGAYPNELARLGEHTTGIGCLYLKNLDRVDLAVLEDIIRQSYARVTAGAFGQRAVGSGGQLSGA